MNTAEILLLAEKKLDCEKSRTASDRFTEHLIVNRASKVIVYLRLRITKLPVAYHDRFLPRLHLAEKVVLTLSAKREAALKESESKKEVAPSKKTRLGMIKIRLMHIFSKKKEMPLNPAKHRAKFLEDYLMGLHREIQNVFHYEIDRKKTQSR